jgi:hypothetical protein
MAALSGDDAGDEEPAPGPSAAMALAEEVGCDDPSQVVREPGRWQRTDVVDCTFGQADVRIYGSLTAEQADAGVRLLTMGPTTGGCDRMDGDPGPYGPLVVSGDRWIAAISGVDEAALWAARVGGTVEEGRAGVAHSAEPLACVPPRYTSP